MQNKGVTLIHLLIAVAIISGISIIGALGYLGYQEWFTQEKSETEDYTAQTNCEDAGYYWYDNACHNKRKIKVSTESFKNTAFPAADDQFPIPDFEKKKKLMIDDFSGAAGEAEFFLLYTTAGDKRKKVKDFYIKELKEKGWQAEKDYSKVDFSKRESPLALSFTKSKNELYKIRLVISYNKGTNQEDSASRSPVYWPEGGTWVKIRENWPAGFEYAKDLSPNSSFCQYFNKDFKKILRQAIGKVKLSGLHEFSGQNDPNMERKTLRMFYYSGESLSFSDATTTEIYDKMQKVKESFEGNGYQANLEEGEYINPIEVSKEVSDKKYSFDVIPLVDGFAIQYPPMMMSAEK